jgi:hypothetical protein
MLNIGGVKIGEGLVEVVQEAPATEGSGTAVTTTQTVGDGVARPHG